MTESDENQVATALGDLNNLQRLLLYDAVEESILYELVWELNTHYPQWAPEKRKAAALETLRDLLSKGWVVLMGCQAGKTEWLALSAEETATVIGEPGNWEPPDRSKTGTPYYEVHITESGERALGRRDPNPIGRPRA